MTATLTLNTLTRNFNDGMVFTGCGGDIVDWINGLTGALVSHKMIDPDMYDASDWVKIKTTGGRIDLFFNAFKPGNEGNAAKLAAKLAAWKVNWVLQGGSCTWLSDYKVIYAKQHDTAPAKTEVVIIKKKKKKTPVKVTPRRSKRLKIKK